MNLRNLVSLCASFLLLAGCDLHLHESEKKPEAPAVTEPAAALPETTAAPEAMQTADPAKPEPVAEDPAKPAQEPLRVGGKVTRPELIHSVPLDLGNGKARIAGVFIAEAVIDAKGNVTNARVLKSSGQKVDAAALAALRQWKFKPATLDGKPVAVYYALTVNVDVQ